MKKRGAGKSLYREYNGEKYSCKVEFLKKNQRLEIEAELPPAFADAPSDLFNQFEDLLMSFNVISSLELIHQQLKLIEWKDSTLAECRDIELRCWSLSGENQFISLEISEFEGKIISYTRPIQYGILEVEEDGNWHWHDGEWLASAHSTSEECDKDELIFADSEKAKTLIKSRFPLFEREAEKIYKQVFSA